jgi:hypothetical protein
MKGILIDKTEIEKLQREYKKLAEINLNTNKEGNINSTLKIEFILEDSEF